MAFIVFYRILIGITLFSNTETAYELFSIGCQLELNSKVEEAIQYYQRARELNPESPEIYVSLAHAFYRIRQFDQGIRIATEGLQRWPKKAEIYHSLAIGNIGKGDYRKALEWYEKSLEIDSTDIEVFTSISILYDGMGDIPRASQVLLSLPDSLKTSDIFMRLARLSGKANDHKSAIDYYQRSYELDTTNTMAMVGIGTAYDILSVKDSAIFYYEKALREDTLIPSVGRRIIELYTDTEQYEEVIEIAQKILYHEYRDQYVRKNLGYAFYQIGMRRQALNEFMIISKIDPQDVYSRFYIGRIYLEQGDYEAASNEIEQAINIDPYFVELWVYLGFIAIEEKNYKTAEYAFTEAAHHGADMVQIYYLLGVVAELQQQYSRAYFHYHRSLKDDSKNLATLEALAHLCDRIGKKAEARITFERVISLDTLNAVALNYVGYSYAERDDSLYYALELINRALSVEGNNGYYIDSRGWVLYQMGRYEEALIDLRRAAETVQDAVIQEHLGDVYMKLNDFPSARDAYQKALEYDTKNKILKDKLLRIRD